MFGTGFLRLLYQEWLRQGLAFLVVASQETELAGFVLGCPDSSRLMSAIYRRPWVFVGPVLKVLLRKPTVLPRLLETLFYSRREDCQVKAELVVIAVKAGQRSQGLGRSLLKRLDREFAAREIGSYKVTVHSEMEASNRFYRQNGFLEYHRFWLYGVEWCLYLREPERTDDRFGEPPSR
jgi:ribosomal protein S18 acetylase RimI-like enzyme